MLGRGYSDIPSIIQSFSLCISYSFQTVPASWQIRQSPLNYGPSFTFPLLVYVCVLGYQGKNMEKTAPFGRGEARVSEIIVHVFVSYVSLCCWGEAQVSEVTFHLLF